MRRIPRDEVVEYCLKWAHKCAQDRDEFAKNPNVVMQAQAKGADNQRQAWLEAAERIGQYPPQWTTAEDRLGDLPEEVPI